MKKILLLLTLCGGFGLAVNAQSVYYKSFKADIDAGGFPSGSVATADVTLELHQRTSDAFALGLRAQAAFNNDGYSSFCLTGDYYLTPAASKSAFRVFTGGGAGTFIQSSGIFGNAGSATNFGAFARIGIELNHLRLSAEYDVTGGEANYVALNLGFSIGGGRRKQAK